MRTDNSFQIDEIGNALLGIWDIVKRLKSGIINDLNLDPKHRKKGNLTALISYGPGIFEIHGANKMKPASFMEKWNFKQPSPEGGGSIVEGSGMTYSPKVSENHLLSDPILIQFIADSEFYTNRAIVEIWKELHKKGKNGKKSPLKLSGIHTGFQRLDQRNWLGFHDGVSNLKSRERSSVILIDSRSLSSQDKWISSGTYLGFIKIALNLENWNDTSVKEQEIIIGRDKLTGCPLIRIDKNGKGVKDARCPVPGTSEIIDPGNEFFRDPPPYGIRNAHSILKYSHIGRARPIDRIPVSDPKSARIYRQGFEFLVAEKSPPGFVAGLNFVSFQNTPERLFRTLTYQPAPLGKPNSPVPLPNFDRFVSVLAAGVFLVPPIIQGEPFPGSLIFFKDKRSYLRREN
jgi:deferrochelatase/peroxidase EfeB